MKDRILREVLRDLAAGRARHFGHGPPRVLAARGHVVLLSPNARGDGSVSVLLSTPAEARELVEALTRAADSAELESATTIAQTAPGGVS